MVLFSVSIYNYIIPSKIPLAASSGNCCDSVKRITLDTFSGKRYQVGGSKVTLHPLQLQQHRQKIVLIWGIKTQNAPYMMSRKIMKFDTIPAEIPVENENTPFMG